MTTSGTTSFTITAEECMRAALENIGVIGEGDNDRAYDFGIAKQKLNLMLKAWQNQAEHLWVRQKLTMFLQKGQPSYEISLTSTDHFTADAVSSTTLTVAGVISDTIITVTSSAGFSVSDYIGIQLDDGTLFWSTVANVLSATSIQISDALTDTAAIGLYVFGYTNKTSTVFNVYSATRRLITSNLDTPLLYQSYTEYTRMPNKFSLGNPNIWSYDRQIDKFFIHIWQNPADVSYYINLVVDRKIQDINVNSDTFDLPQEWSEAIINNLSVRCAPAFGKAQGDNFQELKAQAQESLAKALENDNELGSIFIMPTRSGIRGR